VARTAMHSGPMAIVHAYAQGQDEQDCAASSRIVRQAKLGQN
jgi:hypothetical protein